MNVTVRAMTVRQVLLATNAEGLEWFYYDDWTALPETPAVYMWAGTPAETTEFAGHPLTSLMTPSDGLAIDLNLVGDDVVLYLGKAGVRGLRERYRGLWPYDYSDAPQAHGQARIIRRHQGRLFAAQTDACPDAPCRDRCTGLDGAETWERRLLTLHLHRTGVVPVINGGAWFNQEKQFKLARVWAAQAL